MDEKDERFEQNFEGVGYLPGLAMDFVIFGFDQHQLKILILEYQNTSLYALPGGFVKEKENLNDAARRVLLERTGLSDIYIDQFYTFGDLARYDEVPLRTIMQAKGISPAADHWLLRRFISVGYYALIDFRKAAPRPDPLSDTCVWYTLDKLPTLMLDHNVIVQKALETLRADLDRKLGGYESWAAPLLPKAFTMSELQKLYETILGQKLRRSSFQRKVLGLDILERLEKQYSGGAHKAPYLYQFIAR
ncbi:NUDIX domain-containing protein [Dyadobacter sp. CY345]|uniref:NUDIX hydrolase n=1 Tax=Dyadobacter sp. CY345 TaxID=2909335 RepID=UPI001F281A61|nr:NUDIX domain-containing protein [Dyadobacter sp. CY345]MCF2447092.1 NUDIX domain-containing protein [Dyadobacter sp. CY345]